MSVKRLQEIKDEMESLLSEAMDIVRTECRAFTFQRASAYWIPAIENALNPVSRYDASINEAIMELESADNESRELDDEE
jgi:hypothetical protein